MPTELIARKASRSGLLTLSRDSSLPRTLRSLPGWRTIAAFCLRVTLGLVLLYAGYIKMRQPWYVFAGMIDNYGVVPPSVSEWTARVLPPIEVALGVVLVSGLWRKISSAMAVALLAPFFALMLWAYLKGMKIDCGCFGPGETLGPKTLLRDGVLLTASAWFACLSWRNQNASQSAAVPRSPAPNSLQNGSTRE